MDAKFILLLALLPLLPCRIAAQLVGDRQSGLASYYSPEYDGAETAYGVIYDRNQLVAAHKTYPLNSTVRVTNETNGQSVIVRIIDKGPFIRGRVIEVSERAAEALGMLGERTVPVRLELISTDGDRPLTEPTTREAPAPEPVIVTTPDTPADPEPAAPPAMRTASSPSAQRTPPVRVTTPPAPPARRTFERGLYQIQLAEPKSGRFGVQVGSFNQLESAMDKVVELQARYFDEVLLHHGGSVSSPVYKVVLGTFPDRASAQHYADSLKQRYGIPGFTIELTSL